MPGERFEPAGDGLSGRCLGDVSRLRGQTLQSRDLAESIQDTRLAMEVGAIQALAEKLTSRLRNSDPLSQNVHANKLSFALTGAYGALNALVRRPLRAWRLALDPAQ